MKKTFFIMILITSITLNAQDNVTVTITPDNTNVTGHFGKEEEINTNKTRTLKVILEGVETKGTINANASDNLTIKQLIDDPLFLESIQKPNKAGEFHMTLAGTLDSEIKSSGNGSGGAAFAGFSGTGKGAICCTNYKIYTSILKESPPREHDETAYPVSYTGNNFEELTKATEKYAEKYFNADTSINWDSEIAGFTHFVYNINVNECYKTSYVTCHICSQKNTYLTKEFIVYFKMKTIITMPEWIEYSNSSQSMKDKWDSYYEKYMLHERSHMYDFMNLVERKVGAYKITESYICKNYNELIYYKYSMLLDIFAKEKIKNLKNKLASCMIIYDIESAKKHPEQNKK